MRKLIVLSLLAILMFASSKAEAGNWAGRFYCGPSCTFDAPYANGTVHDFVRQYVNRHVDTWNPFMGEPRTVTICNGQQCATYRYVPLNSLFFYVGYYNSTWTAEIGAGGGGNLPTPGTGGGGPDGPPLGGGPGDGGGLGGCHIGGEWRDACVSTPTGQHCEKVIVDTLVCV